MEIERPKIETAALSPDGRYGKFVVEPLERGFGTTLGNSLRRVLLSSLPGVAVTSVKIDGVVHEFTTIEGVREDVTEIVLNLKGIAAKIYGEAPKTVRVEAVGPCEVTAGTIKGGDDLEILNPEWHIATLGEGAKLVMELTFDKGRGYVPAEKNKQALIEKNDISTLPVDSIYTPVLKVNYTVDRTRVGQITDFDKLIMEVWTDGTCNAQEALSLAARVLTEHLNLFVNLCDETGETEIMVDNDDQGREKALEMTIEELDLSVRSFNCLKRAGINTVGDLIGKSEDEIAQQLDIPQTHASLVTPGLMLFARLFAFTDAKRLWMPDVKLGDGLAVDYAQKSRLIKLKHNFNDDILSATRQIAERYQCNVPHTRFVEKAALGIFDAMKKLHGLGERERLILQLAAIMHDSGKFVSLMYPSEAGYDIIMASEIIGISHEERETVAKIIKYNTRDFDYRQMNLTQSKLTAMLRLANALDRSHKQKMSDLKISLEGDELIIATSTYEDITLEYGLFKEKTELFEEIYGVRPVLRQRKNTR